MLDLLDELGIADDTIVMYSTDNGPHMNTWPDGGDDAVPQREEHQLGGRLPRPCDGPLAGQDPGRASSPTRSSSTTTGCRRSWRRPASRTSSRSSRRATGSAGKTFKVHIDGYNLLPYLTGEVEKSPRQGFIYFYDDGDLVALRFDNWKVVFMEQRVAGHAAGLGRAVRAAAGAEALQPADRSVRARRHHLEHLLRLADRPRLHGLAAQDHVTAQFLETFKEFPPRQKAASFTIDQVVEKMRPRWRPERRGCRRQPAWPGCRRRRSGWARTPTTPRRRRPTR